MLQQSCVRWMYYQHHDLCRLLVHTPNEGFRGKAEGGILKAMGMRKGFPDLFFFYPNGKYHGFAIELKLEEKYVDTKTGGIKVKKTYQTPEQKEYQELLEGQGYRYEVARSVDEFAAFIEEYLGQR